MDFQTILESIGVVGFCVIGCLMALSVYSIGLIVDKYRRFRMATTQSVVFFPEFGRCLREGDLKSAAEIARRHGRSHVAQVMGAGVTEMLETSETVEDSEARVEFVSRALSRTTDRTLAEMKKGLGGLATIGSTAPFIGLFGTVVGIIHAFQGIAASGTGGIAAVSGGIAEALVATALGILVAIPAVMAFNYFTGTLERFHVEMSGSADELIDFLAKRELTVDAGR